MIGAAEVVVFFVVKEEVFVALGPHASNLSAAVGVEQANPVTIPMTVEVASAVVDCVGFP